MRKYVGACILGCLGLFVVVVLAVPQLRASIYRVFWGEPRFEGQAASDWVIQRFSTDRETRTNADDALSRMGDEAWNRNLDNPDSRVRVWAIHQELKHTGDPHGKDPKTREALVALTGLINDEEHGDTRRYAADALVHVPVLLFESVGATDEMAKNLSKALVCEDSFVRGTAATILRFRGFGTKAAAAVPGAVAALKDKDADARKNAIDVLKAIGPSAKTAEPELIRLAKTDPSKVVRDEAASAAKKLDAAAAAAQGVK
jgi:HEAT repeat protein